jgi:hypothetical protein
MATIPTVHIAQHQANLTDAGSQGDPSVIDIGLGRYIVAWTEASGGPIAITAGADVVGQIFDHAGNRVGSEFRLNFSFFGDDEQNAALAARLGGGLFMVYEDGNSSGTSIRAEAYDVNGNVVLSGPFTIQGDTNDDLLGYPSVAMRPDGSYLVVYNRINDLASSLKVVARIVGANGTVGSEFLISDNPSRGPDSAVLSNGNDVLGYEVVLGPSLAFRQIHTPNSTGAGSAGPIDNDGNSQFDVQVAALTGGGFVAAWTEANGDGSSNGIRARVLASNGAAVGTAFTVNLSTAGSQTDPDVVALREGGFVVVWDNAQLGNLQGRRFDALGNAIGGEFVAGDAEGESDPAVAALADGRFVVAYRNFAGEADILATVFDPYGPRTSDFNKDVRGDILWRNDNGTVATWHMDAANILSMQGFANAPNDWHLIDTGDFNGDAMSDLLWRHDGGLVGTWHMNGATIISTQAFANAPLDWHIQGAADFNGDGKTDLLWRHDSGLVGTWHMNGATIISTQAFANAPLDWHIQGTGDFNGDGFDDILWRNDNGAIGTWHMNGATQLSTQAFASQPADWKVQQTGDFNGDGKDDILWRQDNGTVGIWLMNGAQIIGGPTFGGVGNDWHIEGTADFNGDGRDDILWRNVNGTVATWELNGGTILAQRAFPQVSADWHIAGNHYDFL